MVTEHEKSALLAVEKRLASRFPSLDAAHVHQAVDRSYGELTGPIRDFVPLLVEHNARDTLKHLVEATPQPH